MITADYCIYCQIWEKEIGKIYPKTDISKIFPLEKIELDEESIGRACIQKGIMPITTISAAEAVLHA